MYQRTIIALVLITLMSFPASSRSRLQKVNDEQDQEQDLSVLPYDRYDALKLARIFKEELEKGNDIAPLIDKYFVSDFDERFAKEAAENYWFPAKPRALSQASKDDTRRYYVALTNFTFVFMRILCTLETQQMERMLAEGGPDDEEVHEIEKLLPKDVLDAFKSNPHLSYLIPDDPNDEPKVSERTAVQSDKNATNEPGTESDISEHEIVTLEQLHDLSSAMNTAAAKMLDYLKTVSADKTALDYIMPKEDDSETAPSSYAVGENAYISEEASFYGFPEGTRFVCARVLYLHIEMIRIDGDLKVLSVYIPISD